ncbi:MAG TPA: CoA transferase [Candidatus Sulfotelmatobacter sp.]|nr:CoA transferase [Candidatus Sulfotelmatobacter sp.]
MTEPPAGPLAGLVVCDLSTVLAGPYCTMLLGDLGADIIKVEPPEGDGTRAWGPPFVGSPQPGASYGPDDPRSDPGYAGESAYYLAINRNKRGLRLDLRATAGQEILRRLLRRSDVLVENTRGGGLGRLGFPDDELERLNPGLVHLAISGYGVTGPLADRPGYDFIIQAVSGLMSITGDADADGGHATKVGVAISDLTTGMLGAVAVLAALLARGKDTDASQRLAGAGQRIDLSLLESTLSWLANQAANHLIGGVTPGRMGNEHPNITPYETYRAADGELAVAVGNERQWTRFTVALGRPELAADPRFASNASRLAHRTELRALLAAVFAVRPRDAWLAALAAADVPSGPLNDLAQAFADPQVVARGMVATVSHPTAGPIQLPGVPFKLARTPATIRDAPPLRGQHTAEILAWLGFGPAEIAELRASQVV